VYNDITEAKKIEEDDAKGLIRQARLIPARMSGYDGQMKIAVDAILTLDDIEDQEDLDILVVGSGHDPLLSPRLSYEPLFFMVKKSRFFFYDVVEEAGITEVNTNIITRFRQLYDYADISNYDVLIDDSWFQGKSASQMMLRARNKSNLPCHFSIKSFEEPPLVNVYHQVGHTNVGEVRLVSRSVCPDFRENRRLGRCCFCSEIQFFLQRQYPDEFYKSILRLHKHDKCIPREWYREISAFGTDKNRFFANWVALNPSEYEIKGNSFCIKAERYPLRRPLYCNVPGLNSVELRKDLLKDVALVIDRQELAIQIFKSARALYLFNCGTVYQHREFGVVPVESLREQVRASCENQRTIISERESQRKKMSQTKIIREVNSFEDRGELPQEIMVKSAHIKKQVYRIKEDQLLEDL